MTKKDCERIERWIRENVVWHPYRFESGGVARIAFRAYACPPMLSWRLHDAVQMVISECYKPEGYEYAWELIQAARDVIQTIYEPEEEPQGEQLSLGL